MSLYFQRDGSSTIQTIHTILSDLPIDDSAYCKYVYFIDNYHTFKQRINLSGFGEKSSARQVNLRYRHGGWDLPPSLFYSVTICQVFTVCTCTLFANAVEGTGWHALSPAQPGMIIPANNQTSTLMASSPLACLASQFI